MKVKIGWIVFGCVLLGLGLYVFRDASSLVDVGGAAVLALIGYIILTASIGAGIVGVISTLIGVVLGIVFLCREDTSSDVRGIWTILIGVSLAVGFVNISIYSIIESYRCPSCKRKWARKQIDKKVLNQSPVFYEPDNNGKEHPYTNQLIEYHYRCKYCGEEWTKTEEEKKRLDS